MFADGRGGGGGILPGAFSMEKIEPDAAQGMSPPSSAATHYVKLHPVNCNTCDSKDIVTGEARCLKLYHHDGSAWQQCSAYGKHFEQAMLECKL